MVIVFLFPLSLSPCFHCTVLVPVHRVYTSCFHNAVGSSSYRLHTSCLHHTGATSCFSLNMWLQLISWNVSLVRSSWESAHIEFNLWSVYYDMLFMMELTTSPWGMLYPVSTAMLIATMISIRKHSVQDTVSVCNRFPWLSINYFQSP